MCACIPKGKRNVFVSYGFCTSDVFAGLYSGQETDQPHATSKEHCTTFLLHFSICIYICLTCLYNRSSLDISISIQCLYLLLQNSITQDGIARPRFMLSTAMWKPEGRRFQTVYKGYRGHLRAKLPDIFPNSQYGLNNMLLHVSTLPVNMLV